MIRSEIIELTIERMGIEDNYLQPDAADSVRMEDFADRVIASLAQQLPDGDIQTCDDFNSLGIACCDGCHLYHPHTGMKLVTLPDGSKAWLCCELRTALQGPEATAKGSSELAAKESAISAKVAAIPVEERFDRAIKLALECGDNPTEDQSLEFAKLFFGPDVIISCR
jgi:hypothetical protein